VNLVVAVNNFGDTESGGLAGPMALFIVVIMCIATVLLIRNMNKRVRRLPDSFQDVETTRRRAEIARLDADLQSSAVAPARLDVDGDRSVVPGGTKDTEVNDLSAMDASQAGRTETEHS
jgi:hypothetical protein